MLSKTEDENETEVKSDNEGKTDAENESKTQFKNEKVNSKESESLKGDNEVEVQNDTRVENLQPVLENPLVVVEKAEKDDLTKSPTFFEKSKLTGTLPKQIKSNTLKALNYEAYRNDIMNLNTTITQKVFHLDSKKTRPNNLLVTSFNLNKIKPKIRNNNKMKESLHGEYKRRHSNNNNKLFKSVVKNLKNDRERAEDRRQMKWSWRRRKRGKEHPSRRRECREHSRDHEEQLRKVKKK